MNENCLHNPERDFCEECEVERLERTVDRVIGMAESFTEIGPIDLTDDDE